MSPLKDYEAELKELIGAVLREQASDLHISAGRHPTLRIAGRLTPLVKKQVLTPQDTEGLIFAMLDDQKRSKLISERELDFSYNFETKARFRVKIVRKIQLPFRDKLRAFLV